MEDTIRVALARWRDRQPNMASEAFRNGLADEIAILLREKGSYIVFTDSEIEEQNARATWVCSICGENTFEVDSDYVGSGTNHLGCELQLEKEESKKSNNYVYSGDIPSRVVDDAGVDIKTGKYVGDNIPEGLKRAKELSQEGLEEGIRREKNWSQKKHEDKVFGGDTGTDADFGHDQGGSYSMPAGEEVDGMYFDDEVKEWEEAVGYVEPDNDTDVELRDKVFDLQKQAYNEMTSDGLPPGGDAQAVRDSHKLAEEIVDKIDKGYIYESPDGGETIYRRGLGETKRTKLTKTEWKEIKNEKK